MIIEMTALKTLDIEQTQFGDVGADELFELLSEHLSNNGHLLSLETIYLSADGIGFKGSQSLAKFLGSHAEEPLHCM